MNIIILGAAGFLGTNLTIKLASGNNRIAIVDREKKYFEHIQKLSLKNVSIVESPLISDTDFDDLVAGYDIVYHLISTTVPATSNQRIANELAANAILSANLLDSCVRNRVKKVVFLSSGGAVYGKEANCPIKEKTITKPISSYGVQKITIENLLYLYRYLYGLDYRIIRLANPYGPYQRPNGVQGAVTTFIYKALKNEEIVVYGDGSVVRDFIYVDDAIHAILNIVDGEAKFRTFNLGCGYGTSINRLLEIISEVFHVHLRVIYQDGRKADVPINYLDINRYEDCYGKLNPISLNEGIKKTADFLIKNYNLK